MTQRTTRGKLRELRRALGLKWNEPLPRPDDLLAHAREHAGPQVTEREHRSSWSVWDPELEYDDEEKLGGWRYICKGCGASFDSSPHLGGHLAGGTCGGPVRISKREERLEAEREYAAMRWPEADDPGRVAREALGLIEPLPEPDAELLDSIEQAADEVAKSQRKPDKDAGA